MWEAFKTVCKETVSHLLRLAARCFTQLIRSVIRRRLFSCLNGEGSRSSKAREVQPVPHTRKDVSVAQANFSWIKGRGKDGPQKPAHSRSILVPLAGLGGLPGSSAMVAASLEVWVQPGAL